MSNDRTIPVETRRQLWFEAAGRCAICNKNVAEDPLTHFTANEADIAHIHDVNSKTHRFVPSYPAEKLNSAENLLLVCKSCHRVIDNELQATYTVRHLEAFKKRQKQRIELVTSITEDRRSIILIYTAKIGNYIPKITWSEAASAMIPNYFPSSSIPIEISDTTVYLADGDSDFWKAEECKINYVIDHMLKPIIQSGEVSLVSVFALAPQPLLIKLGVALSELTRVHLYDAQEDATVIYQRHREPDISWKWQDSGDDIQYISEKTKDSSSNIVALKIALSANIANDRITEIMGDDCTIWTITIREPYVDFLKTRQQLADFRECYRKLLNRIKTEHGQKTTLNIFPAVPVSVAVEIGRSWMPKADMPLVIYDQNREKGNKFIKAISLGGND